MGYDDRTISVVLQRPHSNCPSITRGRSFARGTGGRMLSWGGPCPVCGGSFPCSRATMGIPRIGCRRWIAMLMVRADLPEPTAVMLQLHSAFEERRGGRGARFLDRSRPEASRRGLRRRLENCNVLLWQEKLHALCERRWPETGISGSSADGTAERACYFAVPLRCRGNACTSHLGLGRISCVTHLPVA